VEVRDAIVDLRSQQEKDKQEFKALEQEISARYFYFEISPLA